MRRPPFGKVLVANRGEIACRIIRTLDRMGIASVAVYSEADAPSLHVAAAGEAVCIGPAAPAASYLDIGRILDAARATGAEAIHPGYGFLSENPDFAEACEAAGIAFIGPTAEQMRAFGLKHRARALAEEAGVPLSPGSGLLRDAAHAAEEAARIGYPVMIKSTAGGGGIGMQLCRDPATLDEMFEAVGRLSRSNFKEAGIYLEKFVESARHIEVQIFGDGRGHVVALGERDCSAQRRNQKIVEETPAPGISDALRRQLFEAAERLGRAVEYRSAGTVEFVYDTVAEEAYFLEVNTRLQVEHGVTEEVTGIDLVEWMVRQAAGEALPLADHAARRRRDPGAALCRGSGPGLPPFLRPADRGGVPGGRPGRDLGRARQRGDALLRPAGRQADRARRRPGGGAGAAARCPRALPAGGDRDQSRLSAPAGGGPGLRRRRHDHPRARRLRLCRPDGRGAGAGHADHGAGPSRPGRLLGDRRAALRPDGPAGLPPGQQARSGNPDDAAGLEITVSGPTLKFNAAAVICLAGAAMPAELDGAPVPFWSPVEVPAGSTLRIGTAAGAGCRAYLLLRGGLDVPEYLGSRSTFTLGRFGGHGGRALLAGDILHLGTAEAGPARPLPAELVPAHAQRWEIGVLYGPHGAPDFFTEADIAGFFAADWQVHYNSSRTGVRLIGPKPDWARPDGGEAGLHPSNIHDNAYAIGTVDFTGDMPVILGPDGPSLGGFVCPATIVAAELWKIGQLRPGDKVRFRRLAPAEAAALEAAQEAMIADLAPAPAPRRRPLRGRCRPGRRGAAAPAGGARA